MTEDERSLLGASVRHPVSERHGTVLMLPGLLEAAARGCPAVWLTPVLRAAGQHPLPDESKALVQRLRHYPSDNLVVGRTADPLWRPGFRGTGTVLEVEGAVADFAAGLR